MANEILTEIRLELDKFRADLKEAQEAGGRAGKKAGDGIGEGIESAFGGIKGKLLGLASAVAGAFTLKASISAAAEQESAINSLNAAMRVNGTFSQEATAHFQALAGALQNTTTAADDAVIQGGALLVTLGKLSGEGLDRATKASLDLAAGLNIDVQTAFGLVSKAAAGNVGAFGRYGIQVKDTGDNARDFANALNALEGRFKGLAAAQTQTFAGAMAQTKNQFGEVLESLGNIVIKSPLVINSIKLVAKAFASIADKIADFAKGRDLISEVTLAVLRFAEALTRYVGPPLELIFNAAKVVFEGIVAFINVAIGGVLQFARAGAFVWSKFSDDGKAALDSINTMIAANDEVIQDSFASTGAAIDGIFNFSGTATTEEMFRSLQKTTEELSASAQRSINSIPETAANAAAVTPGFFSQIATAMADTANKMKVSADTMAKTINQGILGTFTNAFSGIGQALVKGENAFAAFGKAVLAGFGQMLIQLGTQTLAVGLGMAAVPVLFGPQGFAAIAAGIAMITAGGVLTALGGGGGAGAAAGGGGGGGVAANGGAGTAPEADLGQNFQEVAQERPQTKVEVHVAGNILDRRETGLEIAEVINEVFGSNGVTFATSGNA